MVWVDANGRDFGEAQWREFEIHDPSGERFARGSHHPRGSRAEQQETSVATVLVDEGPQCGEQIRKQLYLVEHDELIGACTRERHGIG